MGQPTSVASFCSLSSIQNGGEGWGEEGRFPRLQFRLAKTVPPLPGPLLPRREERGKMGASLILCGVAGINISSLLCTAMPQFNRRLGRFNAEGAEVRRDSKRVLLLCVSPRFLCVSALRTVPFLVCCFGSPTGCLLSPALSSRDGKRGGGGARP